MSNGYSGYYDEENGICWDDENYDEEGDTSTSEPYESQLPEHCQNPWGGYDQNCLTNEAIFNAAERLWEYIFGDSD